MIESMTLSQMLRLSFVMPVLFFLSFLALALTLERIWTIWVTYKVPAETWRQVQRHLEKGDKRGALEACRKSDNLVAEALVRMLSLAQPDSERLVETFQLYRQKLHMELNRRVGFFGTISFISPLVGLFGTVMGIMRAFHDLAAAGAGGPSVVAAGISEALITTAAGIGLAVLSAVLYNYFTLSIRHRMNLLDLWVMELAEVLPHLSTPPQAQG